MIYEIVFSPTGGTKSVADVLVHGIGGEICVVDLCKPSFDASETHISSEDICVIAAPSFGGRAPALAVSRLGQLKGNGARAVLVVVYGNREFEDTLIELKDAAVEAGFQPFAAVSAIAEHSIARQIAAGRPDVDDKAELTGFARKIAAALSGKMDDLQIPGNYPYKEFKGSSAKPAASEACIGCGVCAEECPASAIPTDHPERTDAEKCISCMRCISVCPAGARSLHPDLLAGIGQMLSKVASGRKENRLFL